MTNVPLALGLTAIEVTVFFAVTVRAFGAEARIKRDRGSSVKEARAGRETKLLERIGTVIEGVGQTKKLRENYTDALFRSDWSDDISAILDICSEITAITVAKRRLLRWWNALAAILVVVHISAPAFLLNDITDKNYLSDGLNEAAAYVFSASLVLALLVAVMLLRADLAFERALEADDG